MNQFIKNISYLSTGQLFKIIIRLIAFSAITKSLSLQQYGQFITIVAFCEIFQIFTLPGMSKPIVRSACKAMDQVDRILSSKSGIRNITALVAIALANIAVIFMGYDESVTSLIRYYSIILLLDSLRAYVRIVFKAFEVFKWISLSEMVQSATYLVFVLVSIELQQGVEGIVVASVLSTSISFLIDYINSKKYSNFQLLGGFEVDKVFLISASVFTLTNIMWLIITKIDVLMLSVLTSSDEVAIYGVANRFVFFGLMGISVISNVIYPPIVKEIKKSGQLQIDKYARHIVAVGLFFIFGCLFVGYTSDSIISMIADKKYLSSSEILNILIFYILIQVFTTPIKLILYAVEKEKLLLLIILPLPFIKVILNKLFFDLLGLQGIAYSTVIIYSIYLAALIIINWKLLKNLLARD
jgi:O-antigen/teichoic acid export membrane protein